MSVCDLVVEPGHVDAGSATTEYVHALTGATVELRCSDLTSRHADVRWRRDGVNLEPSPASRFQLMSEDALDIVDVQLDDAGRYSCHELNAFGDVLRKSFVVQVIGMINLKPNTRRRRYSTVELSHIGGVYEIRN